jgi:N-acetylglucosaminyltransferase
MDQLVLLALRAVFLLYVIILLVHGALERRYSSRCRPLPSDGPPRPWATGCSPWPSVDIIIPCFNEQPAVLEACCQALSEQDFPGRIQVWLVDDGSSNRDLLLPVYDKYHRVGWELKLLDRNVGKRLAQDAVFHCGQGDLVVLMDSDTALARDAIRWAAAAFADGEVAAVSGKVGVLNPASNLLTRLIRERYQLRFEVERPAQGYFGSLLCASGPFSAYRRTVVDRLWGAYVEQTFARVPCTSGDDLHLTNLVLAAGKRLLFVPAIHALTNVPAEVGRYLRQQLRWNRSFYRELFCTFRALRDRPAYLRLDVLARALLPLLLGATPLLLAGEALLVGRDPLMADLSLLFAMLVLNAAVLFVHGASMRFLMLYGSLHVTLLIPIRVYALLTLASPRWETR